MYKRQAFEDYTPLKRLFDQQWVGLDNYKYLFSLPGFGSVIWNTIFIAVMKLVGNLIFPVLVALLLNEIRARHFKKTVQTVLYLPHFISWAALAGIFIDILSPSGGIVNQLLSAVGLKPVFFLGNSAVLDVYKRQLICMSKLLFAAFIASILVFT